MNRLFNLLILCCTAALIGLGCNKDDGDPVVQTPDPVDPGAAYFPSNFSPDRYPTQLDWVVLRPNGDTNLKTETFDYLFDEFGQLKKYRKDLIRPDYSYFTTYEYFYYPDSIVEKNRFNEGNGHVNKLVYHFDDQKRLILKTQTYISNAWDEEYYLRK